MCSTCGGGSAAQDLSAQREPQPEQVFVNHYPDGTTEETYGQVNAEARQRKRGGVYRLKTS